MKNASELIYEVGKFYRTQNGEKVECEKVFISGPHVAEFGNKEGAYLVERHSKEIHPWTPVSEWK
jgi:hypothetical protein